MEQLCSHLKDFHEILIVAYFFRKSIEEIQVSLKYDKSNVTLYDKSNVTLYDKSNVTLYENLCTFTYSMEQIPS
jgi:hypothetical protein